MDRASGSARSSRSHRPAGSLLLLVGHPEPAVSIVRSVRRDPRLADILIGAPAGQPELAEWATLLGDDGAAIPFLRYVPERFGPLGARVVAALRERLAQAPSFVALEGYDTVTVLADVLRRDGADRARTAGSRRGSTSRARVGRSGSPACRASASGTGPGRRSRSSSEIRRNLIASGSLTPAESTGRRRRSRHAGRALRPAARRRCRARPRPCLRPGRCRCRGPG